MGLIDVFLFVAFLKNLEDETGTAINNEDSVSVDHTLIWCMQLKEICFLPLPFYNQLYAVKVWTNSKGLNQL